MPYEERLRYVSPMAHNIRPHTNDMRHDLITLPRTLHDRNMARFCAISLCYMDR